MFHVTRNGSPIIGSRAVPYDSAVEAARLLNREYRRKDEFGVAPAEGIDWAEVVAYVNAPKAHRVPAFA